MDAPSGEVGCTIGRCFCSPDIVRSAKVKMESSKEKQFQDENAFNEDKRRFRPLKAIRRMFRDGRKAMGMSHIFRGNVDLASTSHAQTASDDPLFRSFSHESVFTGERVEEARTFHPEPIPKPRKIEVENKPTSPQQEQAPSSKLFQAELNKKLEVKSGLLEEPTALSVSAPSSISPLAQAIISNRDKLLKDVAAENEAKRNGRDEVKPEATEELDVATPLNNSAAYDRIAVRPKNRRRRTTKYLESDNDAGDPWNLSKTLELSLQAKPFNATQAASSVDGGASSRSSSQRRKSEESIKSEEFINHQIRVKKSHSFKIPIGDAIVPSLNDVTGVHLRQTNSRPSTPSSKKLENATPLSKEPSKLSVPDNGSIRLETGEEGDNSEKETISQKQSEKNQTEKILHRKKFYRNEKPEDKSMPISPATNEPETKPTATTPAMIQSESKPISITQAMKRLKSKPIAATPISEPPTPVESETMKADKSPFKVKFKKESNEGSPKLDEEESDVNIHYRDILSALKSKKTPNAEKVVKTEDKNITNLDQSTKENSSQKATTQYQHQNAFERLEETKVFSSSQNQEIKEKNNKMERVEETTDANNPWKNVLKQKSWERKPDIASENKQELTLSASQNKIPRAQVAEPDAKLVDQSSPAVKVKKPLVSRRPVKQLSDGFIKIEQNDNQSVSFAEVESPAEPEKTSENPIFSVKLRKVQRTGQNETQQESQNAGCTFDAKKTSPIHSPASTQRGDSFKGEKSRSLVSNEQSVKTHSVSPAVVMRSKSNRVDSEKTNVGDVEAKRSSMPSWVTLARRHTERYKHNIEEPSQDRPTEEPPSNLDTKVPDEKESTSSNLVIKPPDWSMKNNKTKRNPMNKATSLEEPLEQKKVEKLKQSLSTPAKNSPNSGPPPWLAIAQSRQKRWPCDETV